MFKNYIYLIRPLFLKLSAIIAGTRVDASPLDGLTKLIAICVVAAQSNLRILSNLAHMEKIAHYGFWESHHLFSALKIVALARLLDQTCLNPSTGNQDVLDLAVASKHLLADMAISGNRAANGHMQMLQTVEQFVDSILNKDIENWELDDWLDQITTDLD